MKVGSALIEAALKQAEGEVAVHKANIEVSEVISETVFVPASHA